MTGDRDRMFGEWVDELADIPAEHLIGGLRFVLTSYAFPEQYDVLDADGERVAYVRLRHGTLRVDMPDCGERTVYSIIFADEDGAYGNFRDAGQRAEYLDIIAEIIMKEMEESP